MNIKTLTDSLLDFVYPRYCVGCGNILLREETEICIKCLYALPKTNFHLTPDNPTEKIFWGRVQIFKGSSFLYFGKGNLTQKIIHQFKYKNHQDIGVKLGRLFGTQLKNSAIDTVDAIVPVPLHPIKFKKRGFNQSEIFASGLSDSLNKEVLSEVLFRRIYSTTQTRKGRYERWQNVEDIFTVNAPELVNNKHILLVDDILTTGATLEAAAIALKKAENIKISVATLAIAMDR